MLIVLRWASSAREPLRWLKVVVPRLELVQISEVDLILDRVTLVTRLDLERNRNHE
jgi:hypothetical protein